MSVWRTLPNGRENAAAHPYENGQKAKKNPRSRNGHRRRSLRKKVAALGMPCAICGKPIDYSLPPGHPMSYELDEIVPVALGGSPFDPGNVQPSHRICNERKGASTKGVRRGALPLSREW